MLPERSFTDPTSSSGGTKSEEVAPRSSTSSIPPEQSFKGKMDIIVAGGPDYQRYIFALHARMLGVHDAIEVDNRVDFKTALMNSQKEDQHRPCVVFLGDETWLEILRRTDQQERPLTVVNVNVDPGREDAYDAHILSSAPRADVADFLNLVLEQWPARRSRREKKSTRFT